MSGMIICSLVTHFCFLIIMIEFCISSVEIKNELNGLSNFLFMSSNYYDYFFILKQ